MRNTTRVSRDGQTLRVRHEPEGLRVCWSVEWFGPCGDLWAVLGVGQTRKQAMRRAAVKVGGLAAGLGRMRWLGKGA